MGNRIGRRRCTSVEEKYTRPQGLYEHPDIDLRKLRRLILEAKLAPCYPGHDEPLSAELEDCPICFLYYPSLNRSKCCTKGICTECFLRMKPPHSSQPTLCPFCKAPNYAVEYRGAKTKEERNLEQVEEQRVIEAQLRMRQQQLELEADEIKKKQDRCSSSRAILPTEVEYRDICSSSFSVPSYHCTSGGHIPSYHCSSGGHFSSSQPSRYTHASMRPSSSRHNRGTNIGSDLEEMMVMEAIYHSIQQEQASIRNLPFGSSLPHVGVPFPPYSNFEPAPVQPPPEPFSSVHPPLNAPAFDMLRRPTRLAAQPPPACHDPLNCWIGMPPPNCNRGGAVGEEGESSTDRWSDAAEAGTSSYGGSDIMLDGGGATPSLHFPEAFNMPPAAYLHPTATSMEEQMVLPMTVSFAETRCRMYPPRLTW